MYHCTTLCTSGRRRHTNSECRQQWPRMAHSIPVSTVAQVCDYFCWCQIHPISEIFLLSSNQRSLPPMFLYCPSQRTLQHVSLAQGEHVAVLGQLVAMWCDPADKSGWPGIIRAPSSRAVITCDKQSGVGPACRMTESTSYVM